MRSLWGIVPYASRYGGQPIPRRGTRVAQVLQPWVEPPSLTRLVRAAEIGWGSIPKSEHQATLIFSRAKALSTATARSLRTWTQSSYRSVEARRLKLTVAGGNLTTTASQIVKFQTLLGRSRTLLRTTKQ
jgi:hypothetical protein